MNYLRHWLTDRSKIALFNNSSFVAETKLSGFDRQLRFFANVVIRILSSPPPSRPLLGNFQMILKKNWVFHYGRAAFVKSS